MAEFKPLKWEGIALGLRDYTRANPGRMNGQGAAPRQFTSVILEGPIISRHGTHIETGAELKILADEDSVNLVCLYLHMTANAADDAGFAAIKQMLSHSHQYDHRATMPGLDVFTDHFFESYTAVLDVPSVNTATELADTLLERAKKLVFLLLEVRKGEDMRVVLDSLKPKPTQSGIILKLKGMISEPAGGIEEIRYLCLDHVLQNGNDAVLSARSRIIDKLEDVYEGIVWSRKDDF